MSVEAFELKIIPEEGRYFAARFPDFPGIVTGGDTPVEALRSGAESAVQGEAKGRRQLNPNDSSIAPRRHGDRGERL